MIHGGGSVVIRQPGLLARLGALAERLLARDAPIELLEQQYNFLPCRYRHRGQVWRVRQISAIWDCRASALLSPRRYFRVICQDGNAHILFHDLQLGTWFLSW